jgi:hypothetical protein
MIDWRPIETAPQDGSSILLWARFRAHPLERDSFFEVVAYWHGPPVERWKTRDTDEDLYAEKWAPLSSGGGRRNDE